MQRGARFAFCDRLAIHSRPDSAGAGVNGKTNVFSTLFPTIAFPCSVALKVLGVTSAAARSHIGFSNLFRTVVFIVLKLWRSRALFSDSLWPTLAVLIIS